MKTVVSSVCYQRPLIAGGIINYLTSCFVISRIRCSSGNNNREMGSVARLRKSQRWEVRLNRDGVPLYSREVNKLRFRFTIFIAQLLLGGASVAYILVSSIDMQSTNASFTSPNLALHDCTLNLQLSEPTALCRTNCVRCTEPSRPPNDPAVCR